MSAGDSVTNGELANQTTFNSSFMSTEFDTGTFGVVDLLNNDVGVDSGDPILNLQKNINAFSSATGIPINQVFDYLITWSSTVVGGLDDTIIEKIEALVERFDGATGHSHDGTDGNGPTILAENLGGWNDFWSVSQRVTKTTASGLTTDVSAEFFGRTAGGGAVTEGVITDPPNNKVSLISADTETYIEDAEGQRVYGRLTFAAAVWTLTYYTNEAGVETAHNLSSQDIVICFREIFSSANRPTIGADPFDPGTLDVTADVIDFVGDSGSGGYRGLVPAPGVGDANNYLKGDGTWAAIGASQAAIQFEDEGGNLGTPGTVDELDFTGAGVTASRAGNKVTVNIPGGGSSQDAIQFQDDGSNLGASGTVDTIDFVGPGVTATRVGDVLTVTIPGGGGGGGSSSRYHYIIGSAADVTAGDADYSTFAAALAAHSSNVSFLVTSNYATSENVTITGDNVLIEGQGAISVITGNVTFASGAERNSLSDVKITGNLTFNGGSFANFADRIWLAAASTVSDLGTSNYSLFIKY